MKAFRLLISLHLGLCNALVISDPSPLKRSSALDIHPNTAQDHALNTTLNPTLYPALFPFNLELLEYPQYPLDGAKLFGHIIQDIVNIWGHADNPIIHGNMRWADSTFHMVTYIIPVRQATQHAAHRLDLRSIAYALEHLAWAYLTRAGLRWSCALRTRVSRSDTPAPTNGVLEIVIKLNSDPRDSAAAVNDISNTTPKLFETPVNGLADPEVTVDTSFIRGDITRRMICFLFYEAIRRLCEKDSDSPCPLSQDIGIARIVSPDGQAQMQVTVLQAAPPRRVLTMFHLGKALLYLLSIYANSGRWEGSWSTIRLDGGLAGTVSIEKLPLGLDNAEVGGGDNETATA